LGTNWSSWAALRERTAEGGSIGAEVKSVGFRPYHKYRVEPGDELWVGRQAWVARMVARCRLDGRGRERVGVEVIAEVAGISSGDADMASSVLHLTSVGASRESSGVRR
jgi:hypothetical protein